MTTPKLDQAHLESFKPLLVGVRATLESMSGGNRELLFAYRRKLWKELQYDERSKPAVRRALKKRKFKAQGGRCASCQGELAPEGKDAVLDRTEAIDGYTDENTRLICSPCDRKIQTERRFLG